MIYSFEVNDVDTKFLEAYAEETGQTVGEMAKNAVLEYVEDIMDLRAAKIAKAEYEADPVTYTHEEVGKMLGLA